MSFSKSPSRKPSEKKSPTRKAWTKPPRPRKTRKSAKVKKQGPRAPIIPLGHGE